MATPASGDLAILVGLGAIGGLIFGWFITPFARHAVHPAGPILAWLQYPEAWWSYVLLGAVTAGMVYYAGDLITGAR